MEPLKAGSAAVLSVPVELPLLPRCPCHVSFLHAGLFATMHALLACTRIGSKTSDSARLFPIALQHYILVWLAIVTSPRGTQLDAWLILLCGMDIIPLCLALVNIWWSGQFYDKEEAILVVISVMSKYSPAYQFNNLVLNLVSGSFVDHTYVILVFTVLVTQGHKLFVKKVYCY